MAAATGLVAVLDDVFVRMKRSDLLFDGAVELHYLLGTYLHDVVRVQYSMWKTYRKKYFPSFQRAPESCCSRRIMGTGTSESQ
jgi:hypothetical protein